MCHIEHIEIGDVIILGFFRCYIHPSVAELSSLLFNDLLNGMFEGFVDNSVKLLLSADRYRCNA